MKEVIDVEPSYVYVIRGCTGRYEDYQEWDIGAYFHREQADKVVEILKEAYKKNDIKTMYLYDPGWRQIDGYVEWKSKPILLKVFF
jgi:hypothetical protein